MIYRLERVERNFAYLNSQTSELWLGVRDGDLALLGISVGVSAGIGVCPLQFCPHSGTILESLNWLLSSSWMRRFSGSIPEHGTGLGPRQSTQQNSADIGVDADMAQDTNPAFISRGSLGLRTLHF